MDLLPGDTIARITNGQTITSAYSVVKELLENSLDAGAKIIEIRLDNYGLDKVEIKDDGSGLGKDEIGYMTSKGRYTSKIRQFADLKNGNLDSYGFRGDAVNAICKVSEVKIVSRRSEDENGTAVTCDHNGDIVTELSINAEYGTTVSALNLFKNFRVRRNMILKGTRKEDDFHKIQHLIKAYSIVVPDLQLTVYHNDKKIFQKSIAESIFDSVQQVTKIPPELFYHLNLYVGNAELDLWVAKYFKSDSTDSPIPTEDNENYKVYVFINQRPVLERRLETVLKKYLQFAASQVSQQKPMSIVVCIDTAKSDVDVNLDASKNTVFLVNQGDVVFAVEKKLKSYYETTIEEIEKKKVENIAILVEPKEEPVDYDENKDKQPALDITIKTEPNTEEVDLSKNDRNSPFANDNSFATSLDTEFDKLYASKQRLTTQSVSSNEQKQSTVKSSNTSDINEIKSAKNNEVVPNISEEVGTRNEINPKKEVIIQDEINRMQPMESDMGCSTSDVSLKQDVKMSDSETMVAFDMRSIQQYIQRKVNEYGKKQKELRSRKSKINTITDEPAKVLGQLSPSGYWVCTIKSGVHVVNHHKIQEVVLYKRLLQSNSVPITQISGFPMEIFDSKQEWDQRVISTLANLAPLQESGSSAQRFRMVTDNRFAMNGFDVRIENETNRALLFGTGSSVIPNIGVQDVLEILAEIVKNGAVPVEDCRPQKVKDYLISEATRLERQTPQSVGRIQMEKLLPVMSRHELTLCLHNKSLKTRDFLLQGNQRQKNILDQITTWIDRTPKPVNSETAEQTHPPEKGKNTKGTKRAKEDEVDTSSKKSIAVIGSNHSEFKSLDDIRAKYPIAQDKSNLNDDNNNIKTKNVIKAVEKRMQNQWVDPKEPKIRVTKDQKKPDLPDEIKKLLYDPKRRRGRPLDLPDQTIILDFITAPKTEEGQ